ASCNRLWRIGTRSKRRAMRFILHGNTSHRKFAHFWNFWSKSSIEQRDRLPLQPQAPQPPSCHDTALHDAEMSEDRRILSAANRMHTLTAIRGVAPAAQLAGRTAPTAHIAC